METGERLWQQKIQDSFYGSPVWVNGLLYCTSKSGTLYVVEASGGGVRAEIPLGEPSFATPAVAGGVMYLRTESHLLSIGGGQR